MNFNELKTKVEQGQLLLEDIIVKQYLPLIRKKIFVDSVINTCLISENGILKTDYLLKKLQTDFNLIINYTNLNLDDVADTVDAYDFLKQNNIIEYVVKQIPSNELCDLYELLELEIEEKLRIDNSPMLILVKSIGSLIEKLPKYDTKSFGRLIKSLAKDKPELLEGFSKLLEKTNNK